MSDLDVAAWLVAAMFGSLVLLAILILCLRSLPSLSPDDRPGPIHPISGARDRVAIYRSERPYVQPHEQVLVPMPESLNTRDEMVAWLTKDLPRITEEAMQSKT